MNLMRLFLVLCCVVAPMPAFADEVTDEDIETTLRVLEELELEPWHDPAADGSCCDPKTHKPAILGRNKEKTICSVQFCEEGKCDGKKGHVYKTIPYPYLTCKNLLELKEWVLDGPSSL